MKYILDFEPKEIEEYFIRSGIPAFRAKQISDWVYKKRTDDFSDFTNLPEDLRNKMGEEFYLRTLKLKETAKSKIDGTERYHFVTADNHSIFTVFLPKKDRNSICISTQIGCPVQCEFCFSGKIRFKRNLSRGEILEQIMQVEKDKGVRIGSVLFMGMGEPMLNYENVVKALKALLNYKEFAMGRRHITVSTVGLVPQIRKMAEEKLGIRLALSLHAPDDATRAKVIPQNVPYTVKEILEAGLYFSRKNNSRLTIEYILISEVNDTMKSAEKLIKLLNKCLKRKEEIQINLIPYNDVRQEKFKHPVPESNLRFKNKLNENSILAIIRDSRGADIGSGCGQLGIY